METKPQTMAEFVEYWAKNKVNADATKSKARTIANKLAGPFGGLVGGLIVGTVGAGLDHKRLNSLREEAIEALYGSVIDTVKEKLIRYLDALSLEEKQAYLLMAMTDPKVYSSKITALLLEKKST